jgi:hypothetical protein
MALFIAPLIPFMLLLLMANTLPRKSGREFHRFVNALDWAFTSLMDRTAYNLEVVQRLTKNLLNPKAVKCFSGLDNLVPKKGVLL